MTNWVKLFESYDNINQIDELLVQGNDPTEGLNVLIELVTTDNTINNYVELKSLVKLFNINGATPNIGPVFDIDVSLTNIKFIIENFKTRGILIDILSEIYELDFGYEENIEQWKTIKAKPLKLNDEITPKRLLQYLKYCSKFLSKFKHTKIEDLPSVVKNLIGQLSIEKYQNQFLEDNFSKFGYKNNIAKNPNAIDFIKEHFDKIYKSFNFWIFLASNKNPEAINIIDDNFINYIIPLIKNHNEYKYTPALKFFKALAKNTNNEAVDFYAKLLHSNDDSIFESMSKSFGSFATNENDKALELIREILLMSISEKVRLDILYNLCNNKNDKIIQILIKNNFYMNKLYLLVDRSNKTVIDDIKENWEVLINYPYDKKIIFFKNIAKNTDDDVLDLLDLFLTKNIINGAVFFKLLDNNNDKVVDVIGKTLDFYGDYYKFIVSSKRDKFIDLIRKKWDNIVLNIEFSKLLFNNPNDKALDLIEEKWDEFTNNNLLPNYLWVSLASNTNDRAINIIIEKWDEIPLDNIKFFENLASNTNYKAINIIREKWDEIPIENMKFWISLSSNDNDNAIILLTEKFTLKQMYDTGIFLTKKIFLNKSDKAIELLENLFEFIISNPPIIRWAFFQELHFLLENKNIRAIKLYEKVVKSRNLKIKSKSISRKYLSNPNIFTLVEVPFENEYKNILDLK